MCKINVKKSILEIVENNNLEILKIDLCNYNEPFVKLYGEESDMFSCKTYTTLEDLDFEIDSIFMQEEVQYIAEIKILKNQYGLYLRAMKEVLGGKLIKFLISINLGSISNEQDRNNRRDVSCSLVAKQQLYFKHFSFW